MVKMNEIRAEIEDGLYELENLESELDSINHELLFLENRKKDVEKNLRTLRTKFGPYKTLYQKRR